ncbi:MULTISPECIES: insulinase family protein [unclassified Acinetobacter]|uniref:insulinase family protein n=1 Tax=unclassified Acinetobacter TaxID=196816 RepID=UPI0035BAD0BA
MTTAQTTHPDFELIRQQYIASIDTTVFEFRHKVTQAVHYHLANKSDENVFLVAFRTQPMTSKGEAHILEHTVLCGSKQYPVRDPFFSMIKRSLNTFMNAFTGADWTAYPFATQNKKDFDNLLSIYLDAAFFANINELDFMQEGIRVELVDDKPVFKGIVFNEMKGASSSPDDQLYHTLAHHLFPSSTYHYNSGGDPAQIPDLTYAELKAFYQRHYHPSNAVFMTFGDGDVFDLHEKIQQRALKHFERGETLAPMAEQRLTQPLAIEDYYAYDEEDISDKSYHIMGWLLPESTDLSLLLALRLVEGVLIADSAAPLRQYLETCKLGQSSGPIMGLDDSHAEMTFFCGIQGSELDKGEAFEQGVLNVLQQVASQPIAQSAIDAVLHRIELNQRETSTGATPYGLHLILGSLYHAIHHGDPIQALDLDNALSSIRTQLANDPMYLSNLIQKYLIDNPHRVRLSFAPDQTITAKKQAAEQARLDVIESDLDDAKRAEIIEKTQALEQRQATPDDLEVLPKVGLEDIQPELKRIDGEKRTLNIQGQDYPLYLYETGTNGLYYQQVIFDIPADLLNNSYLEYLDLLVGSLGAGDDDYLSLQQQQTAISGGVSTGNSIRSSIHQSDNLSALMKLNVKALNRNPQAIDLAHHILTDMRFDEKQRILDILKKRRSNWADALSNYGHAYAMEISSRGMSAYAQRENKINGLEGLNWLTQKLKDIEQNEQAYQEFIDKLKATHQALMQAPRAYLLICEASQTDQLLARIQNAWQKPVAQQTFSHQEINMPVASADGDQAWLIQSNVQFCAKSYAAVPVGHADAAPLMVLANYLRNGYLHSAIRERGGAYGGGAGYDGQSCSFRFYSYRDPRLTETLQDFDHSITWLLNEPQQEYQLEEAILGLIAGMDKPSSPANEAAASCFAELHGRGHAFRTELRQRLLDVTLDDLKRVCKDYLLDKPACRAVLAPASKQAELESLGFSIHKLV